MSNHLDFISAKSRLTFEQLKLDLVIDNYHDDDDENQVNICSKEVAYVYKVTSEEVKIGGVSRIVRRVFIRSNDSGKYARLGWVLMNDVDCCMICVMKFKGLITSYPKYHCHACGNIVCSNCSNNYPIIKELSHFDGKLRVCNFCFFGQVSLFDTGDISNTSHKSC